MPSSLVGTYRRFADSISRVEIGNENDIFMGSKNRVNESHKIRQSLSEWIVTLSAQKPNIRILIAVKISNLIKHSSSKPVLRLQTLVPSAEPSACSHNTRAFETQLLFTIFLYLVRSQGLTATSMEMAVFWDVAPCSLVHIKPRFRGAYCLHHKGDCDRL
jgi:hypothetical protein